MKQTDSIIINYNVYHINLVLDEKTSISGFPASTIRGGFGTVLKSLVCSFKGRACSDCLLRDNCAYSYLFETTPPRNSSRLKKYRNIPRPFTINPVQDKEKIRIRLLLIGNAADYLPYFIYTFNKLGKRGLGKNRIKYRVESVKTPLGEKVYPVKGDSVPGKTEPCKITLYNGKKKTGKVKLEFETPLVLRKNGKILAGFNKDAFIKTLLRRITNLNAFYGENKNIEFDPAAILNASENIDAESDFRKITRSRYSTRQKERLDYSGIKGNTVLKGDVGTLMPLLKAGEIFSAGKNTVFGYGRYKLEEL